MGSKAISGWFSRTSKTMNAMANQVTKTEAEKALAGMFVCFNLAGNELERKIRHDAYWAVLGGLPPHAVAAACRDAAQGRLGDGRFVPTAAMIYQRATSYLPRSVNEKLADEPIIAFDERARVNAGFAALSAALKGIDLSSDPMVPRAAIPGLREISSNVARLQPMPPREWKSIEQALTDTPK